VTVGGIGLLFLAMGIAIAVAAFAGGWRWALLAVAFAFVAEGFEFLAAALSRRGGWPRRPDWLLSLWQ
jgi:hypothetical protein